MKTPTHCPFCKDPLLNLYTGNRDQYLDKVCNKKVGHKITFAINVFDDDSVLWIAIPLSLDVSVLWYPSSKSMWLKNTKDSVANQELPYFVPDLSNYKKLITKVKTYILFS